MVDKNPPSQACSVRLFQATKPLLRPTAVNLKLGLVHHKLGFILCCIRICYMTKFLLFLHCQNQHKICQILVLKPRQHGSSRR